MVCWDGLEVGLFDYYIIMHGLSAVVDPIDRPTGRAGHAGLGALDESRVPGLGLSDPALQSSTSARCALR